MAPKRRGKNDDQHAENDSNDGRSSYFQKTVCLHDWWLVKADTDFEGKRLAVAGSTARELKAVRLFTSAPIVKRYDVFTLETADCICVCIKGFINKQRTLDNGFSSEVFNHFSFGFPPSWEECARKYLGEKVTTDIEVEVVPDSCKSARHTDKHEKLKHVQIGCGENASKGSDVLKQAVNLSSEVAVKMDCPPNVTEQTNAAVDASNTEKLAANLKGSVERVNRSPLNMATNKVNFRRKENVKNVSPVVPGSRKTRSHVQITEGSQKKNSNVGLSIVHKERPSKTEIQRKTQGPHSLCLVNERCSPWKEIKRKLDFEQIASPVSEAKNGKQSKQSVISPQSLKCSRSGRLLLPPLEFWRNQIPVYDQNRSITGIKEEVDVIKRPASRSEPQKRRKLLS